MHEASLARDLVHQVQNVAQAQKIRKVLVVRLKVGLFSHISEEHLREHFALASRGTVAQGASLVMESMNGVTGPEAQSLVLDSLEVEG